MDDVDMSDEMKGRVVNSKRNVNVDFIGFAETYK